MPVSTYINETSILLQSDAIYVLIKRTTSIDRRIKIPS